MWEALVTPIDPTRTHEITSAMAYHGRAMTLAWGILAPLAVIIARFCKILPWQDWPRNLDSRLWWRIHLIGQLCVAGLTVFAFVLIYGEVKEGANLHSVLGYGVLAGLAIQVLFGFLRGSKGGPTAPARDGSWRGHHYDMTPWRRAFELVHKTLGYLLLAVAAAAILAGMWTANALMWMWFVLAVWWPILIVAYIWLQNRGLAVDTYQAIWGDDPAHPGNQLPPPRWGVRRPSDTHPSKPHASVERYSKPQP